MKNGSKLIQSLYDKLKANQKGFGTGGAEVVSALCIINNLTRAPLSPIKLQAVNYCIDFALHKEVLKDLEREEFKYIIFKLDKIVLLPFYVRHVTASTYFYWCRDLLPLFFQTIY